MRVPAGDDLQRVLFGYPAVRELVVAVVDAVGALVDIDHAGLSPVAIGVGVADLDIHGQAVVVEGDDEGLLVLIPAHVVAQVLLALRGLGVGLQGGQQVAVTDLTLAGLGGPGPVPIGLLPDPPAP